MSLSSSEFITEVLNLEDYQTGYSNKRQLEFDFSRDDSSTVEEPRVRTNSHEEFFAPSFNSQARAGTVLTTVFSLVSMILGGGVLSLPYAFSQTGLFLGLALLVFFGLAADYSIFTLAACSRRADVHKYEGLIFLMLLPIDVSVLVDLYYVQISR